LSFSISLQEAGHVVCATRPANDLDYTPANFKPCPPFTSFSWTKGTPTNCTVLMNHTMHAKLTHTNQCAHFIHRSCKSEILHDSIINC